MVRSAAVRRYLLIALLAGLLLLPGSEGWSGALAGGDRLTSEHRLLSALRRYDEATQLPGGTQAVQVRLGRTYLRRGEGQKAAEIFRQVDARGASSREALMGLAEALDRLGDTPSSLAVLRRELDLRPGNGEAWTRLVERAAGAGLRSEEIRGLLEGLPVPSDRGALGQRVAYLLGACTLDPGSEEGSLALRRAASGVDSGVSGLALELLEATEGVHEAGARGTSLARGLLAQGLVGPALDQLERVGGGDPWEAEAWALRGYALWRIGRLDQAEKAVRRSLELSPDQSLGGFLLGALLRVRGDSEGAARQLQQVARRQFPNPAVYAELANALIDLGDYGNAEQALRRATEEAPDSAELRLAVARFYVDRQYRVEIGLAEAREAVRLSGGSSEALGALGWSLHLMGRSEEALDPLREAVVRAPESPLLRYRLGSVYEGLGQRDRAREQYLMVAELDGAGDYWKRTRVALEDLEENPS